MLCVVQRCLSPHLNERTDEALKKQPVVNVVCVSAVNLPFEQLAASLALPVLAAAEAPKAGNKVHVSLRTEGVSREDRSRLRQ